MSGTYASPPPRVAEAQDRSFESAVPGAVLDRVQQGVMRTLYRGVPFLKSPFDIALHLQLLSRLQPNTVIEIGTKAGGSALWFADMLSAAGVPGRCVVSVDIEPAALVKDPRIAFLTGDARDLGPILTPDLLAQYERPWLVVEDSSHLYLDVAAVLAFFDGHLRPGDYIVVEDGVVSQLGGPRYRGYEDGPNRAVAEFLRDRADRYKIDASLCDLYGHNVTYNPNGWLRRA